MQSTSLESCKVNGIYFLMHLGLLLSLRGQQSFNVLQLCTTFAFKNELTITKSLQTIQKKLLTALERKNLQCEVGLDEYLITLQLLLLGTLLHSVKLNDSCRMRVSILRQRSYSSPTFGVSMVITDNGTTYLYHCRLYCQIPCFRLFPRCCFYVNLFRYLYHYVVRYYYYQICFEKFACLVSPFPLLALGEITLLPCLRQLLIVYQ